MSPLRSSAGPAVWTNGTPELLGDDPREARLAQARRAGQQDVVERVAAGRGGGDRDAELLLAAPPARRSRRAAAGAAWRRARPRRARAASGSGRRRACGCHRRAPFRACAIRSSGVLARRAVEQLLGLGGGEAEPDEALAGQQARIVAAGDHDRVVGRRGADLLAQLDDDPLGRALADRPARPAAARCRPPRRRPAARAAAPPESTASATFGPTDWTPISSRKRSRSASEAKP